MERLVMLRTIDNLWVEHLTLMEQMGLASKEDRFSRTDGRGSSRPTMAPG